MIYSKKNVLKAICFIMILMLSLSGTTAFNNLMEVEGLESDRKLLPEINYLNSSEDINNYSVINGFASVNISSEWISSSETAMKSIKCIADNTQIYPVIYFENYDKRWTNYAGFSVDLWNPNEMNLPITIKFKDNEGDNIYEKNIILHAKSDIVLEVYIDELLKNGINPGSVDELSIEVNKKGSFEIFINNLRLIPKYSGSVINTFNLKNIRSDEKYDEHILAVTLQGLVNRKGPRLVMIPDDNVMDTIWLDLFNKNERWLSGYSFSNIETIEKLVDTYINEIRGIVIWDENVPATLNLASTMAGIHRVLPVRYDTTEGSLYKYLFEEKKLPVLKDFRGLFNGYGEIPDISIASSGSSKADAYIWAKEMYLESGLVDPSIMGQLRDGYFDPDYPNERKHIHDRDYVVMRKGFFFDLNCWPDDVSNDDPAQPAGADYNTLVEILESAHAKLNYEKNIEVIGYIAWHHKYSDKHNDSGADEFFEFPTEYQNIKVLTENNAVLNASEGSPNISFYSNGEKINMLEQNPPPELPQLENNKTYILYTIGDFDGAYGNWGNWRWHQASRNDPNREIPVAYTFNPQVQKYLPDIYRYYYETKNRHDYFVGGPSGHGYVLSSSMSSNMAKNYIDEGIAYYSMLGYKVANFNISGYVPSDSILSEYARMGLDGYGHNGVSWPGWIDTPSVVNEKIIGRMAVNNLISIRNADGGYVDAAADIKHWVDLRWGNSLKQAKFLTVRVFQDWPYAKELERTLNELYPFYNFEFVDPYTYYSLLRQRLGGNNEYRMTFVSNDVPDKIEKDNKFSVNIGIRNDGTDTWKASDGLLSVGNYLVNAKLVDKNGTVIDENIVGFSKDIHRGEKADINIVFNDVKKSGDYEMNIDLIHYGFTSFQEVGNLPLVKSIRIKNQMDEIPGNFSLRAPSKGHQQSSDVLTTFKWTESAGADKYSLIISSNPDLSDPELIITDLKKTTYTLQSKLKENKKYYWSVKSVNSNGETNAINSIIYFENNDNMVLHPSNFRDIVPSSERIIDHGNGAFDYISGTPDGFSWVLDDFDFDQFKYLLIAIKNSEGGNIIPSFYFDGIVHEFNVNLQDQPVRIVGSKNDIIVLNLSAEKNFTGFKSSVRLTLSMEGYSPGTKIEFDYIALSNSTELGDNLDDNNESGDESSDIETSSDKSSDSISSDSRYEDSNSSDILISTIDQSSDVLSSQTVSGNEDSDSDESKPGRDSITIYLILFSIALIAIVVKWRNEKPKKIIK